MKNNKKKIFIEALEQRIMLDGAGASTALDVIDDKIKLELIGIDYMKNRDDYEINLIFNNNAHIALTTETIEVRLEDQNEIEDK